MPIHVFHDSEGYHVWTEIEGAEPKRQSDIQFGRCIGSALTLRDATWDAVEELTKDLTQLTKPLTVIEEK